MVWYRMSVLLIFCLLSLSTALPSLLFSQQGLFSAVQSYWSPAEKCRQVVHVRLSPQEAYIDDVSRDLYSIKVPIMLSSKDWVTDPVEEIWDPRAHCIFHLLISSTHQNAFLSYASNIFKIFGTIRELEYYFVLTTCPSCWTKSWGWLYSQIGVASLAMPTLRVLARGQTYRPFMVMMELNPTDMTIEHVHNFWQQCPQYYICVTSLFTKVPDSTQKEFISYALSSSFPKTPRSWLQPVNYGRYSIIIGSVHTHYFNKKDLIYVEGTRWRDFFSVKGIGFAAPLIKVELEVLRYLNATYFPFDSEQSEAPLTVIAVTRAFSISKHWRSVGLDTFNLNFMYCLNSTASETTNVAMLFQPLDLWTWLLFVATVLNVSCVIKKLRGYFPWFKLTRAILDPEAVRRNKAGVMMLTWMISGAVLAIHYTSFIQSLLVVPVKYTPLEGLEDLAKAGYRILYAESYAEEVGLRGEYAELTNWFGLEKTADLIETTADSPAFWKHFFKSDKRAYVGSASDMYDLVMNINGLLKEERCFVGRKQTLFALDLCLFSPPNTAIVNNLFSQLQATGILQLYYDSALRREAIYDTSFQVEAIESVLNPILINSAESNDEDLTTLNSTKMIFAYFAMGVLVSLCSFLVAHILKFRITSSSRVVRLGGG